MFWADKITEAVKTRFAARIAAGEPLVIRDEKTASGRVHVGSMRGVAIHGTIHEALAEAGIKSVFRYEINDFDPMDGMPVYLDASVFSTYMGRPLNTVPAPDAGAENFAEYFAQEFQGVIAEAGYTPEYHRASELYLSGRMNDCIRLTLQNAETIRRIYAEVSGSQRQDSWLPLNVICENCGKVGTTRARDFDGEQVSYTCVPDAVTWAHGCGHSGNISPFDGRAKLPWKVEWAAKWKVLSVDIEGAGKDHSTKGGARDVANHISREVFGYEPPLDAPYEFFLVGGKKMSSSKGAGSSAREIADLLPPQLFRLALIGKDINQQFNFDPDGETIPTLYDTYDKYAASVWQGIADDNARVFSFIHAPASRELLAERFLPRFSQVAFLVQMPHMNIQEEITALKGSALTALDMRELDERTQYARFWLDGYAPEKYRFVLQESLPASANELSALQRKALGEIHAFVAPSARSGEELHAMLHGLKDSLPITPQELFSGIYQAFLGRADGPKAGWFLSVLPREFLLARLKEASGA